MSYLNYLKYAYEAQHIVMFEILQKKIVMYFAAAKPEYSIDVSLIKSCASFTMSKL